MTPKQGDVALLNDPIAQTLLHSRHLAHLAYVWSDGTPRVIPIAFTWTGTELVVAGPSDAPRSQVLHTGCHVAVEIDTDAFPDKVLLIRGTVRADTVPGMVPEWAMAVERTVGPEAGKAAVAQTAPLFREMTRLAITPEWVAILDFEQRFPSAMARAIARAHATG